MSVDASAITWRLPVQSQAHASCNVDGFDVLSLHVHEYNFYARTKKNCMVSSRDHESASLKPCLLQIADHCSQQPISMSFTALAVRP